MRIQGRVMLARSALTCLRVHSGIRSTVSRKLLLAGVAINRESVQVRGKSFKRYLDYSNVPKLDEADLEEQFVRGSGPGGQATNKTNNAVLLRHKPTGLVVKCHETRSQWDNKKRAREILVTKLDNLLNKERSIEAQIRVLEEKQRARQDYKRRKLDEMKRAFREREGLT
ncbi:PREDICTED: probable peptide chain release factor C12orf65 homolog, mitochondrial [Vollenhovia emeryi]|uniref:probable peptide chain release factor C12orf65 homolog, mitochondrial n=1 Tax=Vollenhovia emeryi TaxID=411798 RepID=UPI0005F561D5|nr:PREDICTED: probable peptide chain release factor C12orf65 homolog, mitochondrial [Vollenhovia emeryi]